MEEESRSAGQTQSVNIDPVKAINKKSFRQLFSREELWYYGIAALVYIGLGVMVKNWVLNLGVGILYFVVWMWIVPPFVAKLRGPLFNSIFGRSPSVYTGNPDSSVRPADIAPPQNQPEDEIGKSTTHSSVE